MSNNHLYLSALIVLQNGSLFGYAMGYIGGILVLPSFLHHFRLDELPPTALAGAQSRIVLLWIIGAFFGVLVGIPLCQRYGRKLSLITSALLFVIGAGMQLARFEGNGALALFSAGRFLNGLGVGVGTLVSPMYISEISPPLLRGPLMSGYQTLIQLTALAGFWAAFASHSIFPETSIAQWQLPVAIQLVPGIIMLAGMFFVPETPRYSAQRGHWEKAEKDLAWLRGLDKDKSEVQQELNDIRETIDTARAMKMKHRESFLTSISKKGVRNRLGVGVGLMVGQNMVGLNGINYYAPVIFMSAGFTSVSSSLFLAGTFGIIKLLASISFQVFGHRKKNRFWLVFGSATCGVCMLILALLIRGFASQDKAKEGSITVGGVVCVLMVYCFTFAFGMSLGPISWTVCAEIFPLHLNAKCCAITTCTQWIFMGVIAAITPRLLTAIGWWTYIFFSCCCFILLIWVIFCVPETKGVPLGRPMDELFGLDSSESHTVEEVSGPTETTALLANEHDRRRMSLS